MSMPLFFVFPIFYTLVQKKMWENSAAPQTEEGRLEEEEAGCIMRHRTTGAVKWNVVGNVWQEPHRQAAALGFVGGFLDAFLMWVTFKETLPVSIDSLL